MHSIKKTKEKIINLQFLNKNNSPKDQRPRDTSDKGFPRINFYNKFI